jgi:hypothetical protein
MVVVSWQRFSRRGAQRPLRSCRFGTLDSHQ